jgi:hypothetical protein
VTDLNSKSLSENPSWTNTKQNNERGEFLSCNSTRRNNHEFWEKARMGAGAAAPLPPPWDGQTWILGQALRHPAGNRLPTAAHRRTDFLIRLCAGRIRKSVLRVSQFLPAALVRGLLAGMAPVRSGGGTGPARNSRRREGRRFSFAMPRPGYKAAFFRDLPAWMPRLESGVGRLGRDSPSRGAVVTQHGLPRAAELAERAE